MEDVERTREELIRRGVEPIAGVFPDERSPWPYFCDPEGNIFEIKQRVPVTPVLPLATAVGSRHDSRIELGRNARG